MQLRAPWHDYTGRCIYMVTLAKAPEAPCFGMVAGDYRIAPGSPGCAFVSTYPTGSAIKNALRSFFSEENGVRLLQYAIMPDHLHLLLFVERQMEETLGNLIARLKVEINNSAGFDRIFDKGFNDQILKPTRSLNDIYTYLRENPQRLAIRFAHPEFFSRVHSLEIGGRHYQAYGNFQLLSNPFKAQVVIHRSDTQEVLARNRAAWLYTAANGGVLVSPFISQTEKALRTEAESLNGKFIVITHTPMPERWKPSAHDFELCSKGRLLLLLPAVLPAKGLTRAVCMAMNEAAREVAQQS